MPTLVAMFPLFGSTRSNVTADQICCTLFRPKDDQGCRPNLQPRGV